MAAIMWTEIFDAIVQRSCEASLKHYGDRLVSFAVFGSVARGSPRPDSDIDLLIVAEPLPQGRMARVREFEAIDRDVLCDLAQARAAGVSTTLSPVLKTPAEVEAGSLLFLDLVEEARILVDRAGFLRGHLDRLGSKLRELGARRIRKGGGYYWVLKPGLKPGEEICL